jgi:hypothetical protein
VGPNGGELNQITAGKIEGDKITRELADSNLVEVNAAGEGRTLKSKTDVKGEK